jgi:hypothetical protein
LASPLLHGHTAVCLFGVHDIRRPVSTIAICSPFSKDSWSYESFISVACDKEHSFRKRSHTVGEFRSTHLGGVTRYHSVRRQSSPAALRQPVLLQPHSLDRIRAATSFAFIHFSAISGLRLAVLASLTDRTILVRSTRVTKHSHHHLCRPRTEKTTSPGPVAKSPRAAVNSDRSHLVKLDHQLRVCSFHSFPSLFSCWTPHSAPIELQLRTSTQRSHHHDQSHDLTNSTT